jgi:ABC-type spermidine/putrescine transport system permease subunit II
VIFHADQVITWIHVPKPTLDMVGIVLGSLRLAAVAAVLATALGAVVGLVLIARNRRRPSVIEPSRLHLLESSQS